MSIGDRMGRISLIQLVAVINSLTESFEVTKWYDQRNGDPQRMTKELLAITKKLYSKIVEQQGGEVPDKKMIAVGESSQVLDAKSSKAKDIIKIVHYAWYKGRCLDPKKLSYFIPEKTLAEGDMTVEETRNL